MSAQPTIGDLSGLFQPVQQQSALAQTLLGTKGDKLAALMYRQPMAAPAAPELKFGVTPGENATSDFLGQGIGGGINNYLAMRGYSQQQDVRRQYQDQQKQLFDLAQQRDLAAAQKAQEDAAATNTFIKTLPPHLQPIYQQSDDIGRRALLKDLAAPDLGTFIGQGKGAEAQAAAPALGDAAGTQKAAEVQRIGKALMDGGVDVNTPQGKNLFHALLGFDPTTQVDIDLKDAQARKARVEAIAAPTLTAQEIQQNSLTMQSTQLNNVLQGIRASFEPERLKAEINGQQLTNTEKADKLTRVDTAMQVFSAFQERLARGEVTPQDVAQVQSNIGMLSNLDPSLDTTLKRVLGLKQDDKLDAKRLKEVFTQQTTPSPANWGIPAQAVNGNLVQAPSGNWYDKTTGKQVSAPAAKPAQKPAPPKPVKAQPAGPTATPQIWNSPAPPPNLLGGKPLLDLFTGSISPYGKR